MSDSIGYIIGGGLKEGLRVRLTAAAEQAQEGSFVVCDSGRWRYYGLVTDLQLAATDPRFADEQSGRLPPAVAAALRGQTLFTTLVVYPTLMQDLGPEGDPAALSAWLQRVEEGAESREPKPVKIVPAHHAAVRAAAAADVAEIFGRAGPGMFAVGQTIEQRHEVRLDLRRLIKRSSGIFGATGTGKSFLTRIVLAGLMKEDAAGALVFDMHNEYAFDDLDADQERQVAGLKSLFGEKVQVAALGRGATFRGHTPDFTLEIARSDIQAGDVLLLARALDLTDTAAVTLGALVNHFGDHWFDKFMKLRPGAEEFDPESNKSRPAPDSVAFWARLNNINERAAEGLHRKLAPIHRKPYVAERPAADAVQAIVDKLENGRHVILSFGEFDEELDYLLVSNILTRRIRQRWVKKTEAHKSRGAAAPRPLVIVVEEAHKLLGPDVSSQTAFGTIARELRKYFVTLLIIDQRPSGIDDEVMSQLGTRITGWLGDDDDIQAVLSGLAGREQLRGMLARLQEKEEVLLLGWGVKMPIPIRSRRYDEAFWREMRGGRAVVDPGRVNEELFGSG